MAPKNEAFTSPKSGSLKDQAVALAGDKARLKKLITSVLRKLDSLIGDDRRIKGLIELLRIFVRMIRGYLSREYKEIPWKSLVYMVAGLLYFVMPFDVIPDFIPLAGLLDDATVMYWIASGLKDDILAFRQWEKEQVASPTTFE